MSRKKKSLKQLIKEREIAREEKRKEFESEYPKEKKAFEELGFGSRFQFDSLEDFVKKKLKEWENRQPKILAGKYQDENNIVATYQKKFVEFTCQLCPDIIEELRAFVPYFDKLFGENKDKYISIFDSNKMEIINLDDLLNIDINSLITKNSFLDFRPERNKCFRYDYKWGEYRLLFQFLYLLFVQMDEHKRVEIFEDTIKILQANLLFQRNHPSFPENIEESNLQSIVIAESERIVKEIISNPDRYFAAGAKKTIQYFLQDISTDAEHKLEAFITLQIELLKWAEDHSLEKEWLLRYAFDFLKQFSDNPSLKVSKIEIGQLQTYSLITSQFEFKFGNWFAGVESKEAYEKRLRNNFESELERYFQYVGWQLNLDEKKRITKPHDPDLVKPLVRKVIQKWSFEKIVELDFGISDSISTNKYFARKVKYLKEELPKFMKFNLPY